MEPIRGTAPAPRRSGRRPPRPPRDRSEGSFLRRNIRVPGTLGLVIMVLALAVGTGFVGAFVWASNDAKNIRTQPLLPTMARPSDSPADAEVTTTTKPDLSPDGLKEKLGPSVWSVRTFDSAGQPAEGSAVLTRSAGGQGLLLTSLAVVEASTHVPAPDITVAGGGFNGKAQLWTWDAANDLALLVVGGTSIPALSWVADPASVKVGDRIFALGGDRKLKPGIVTGVSNQALEHNVFVDDALRGGPMVNVKGEVVGVSSVVFTAGGLPTETTFFAVPIRSACITVLSCSGAFSGPGGEAPATPSSPESTTAPTITAGGDKPG